MGQLPADNQVCTNFWQLTDGVSGIYSSSKSDYTSTSIPYLNKIKQMKLNCFSVVFKHYLKAKQH